ncbi:MAG: Triose-phosphate Transporter [Sclerophora amabilis]|nr:MAG: Triose-phosphate Transporter [Sclerophora amabilis]
MDNDFGHRRRRSLLQDGSATTDGSGGNEWKGNKYKSQKRRRRAHDEIQEEGKDLAGDEYHSDISSQSTSDDVEMEELPSDEGLEDDEETGLTGQDRRRRRRKKKSNTRLDSRVARDGSVKSLERTIADQSVLKKSIVNTLLILSWYLFSLSISIYNKWMFSPEHLDFHFPLFTTSVHMIVQFSLASLVLYLFPRFRPRHGAGANHNPDHFQSSSADQPRDAEKPLMTKLFFATRIGPCGLATGLDIGLGNMSLKFITLTFFTMCKSSALAFVLLFAFLFRLETPSLKLVLIIFTMTVGVVMMVAGETAFNAIGFILVISSAFFSGFRWALTQILLLRNPATSNPFSSIFFLAPIMFLSLIVIALPVERPGPLATGLSTLFESKGVSQSILILLFPGVLAFLMTSSEFALLQRTSVVTLSICGIFKEVVTISAAGIVFHDPLTPINVSGLLITIASIAAYNYIKISKMRKDARDESHGAIAGSGDGYLPVLDGTPSEVDRAGERRHKIGNASGSNIGSRELGLHIPPRILQEASEGGAVSSTAASPATDPSPKKDARAED